MKFFSGLIPGKFSAIYKKCAAVAPPIFPMISISKEGRRIYCLGSESCQVDLPLGIVFIAVILRSSNYGPVLPCAIHCSNKSISFSPFFSIMAAKIKLMKIKTNLCTIYCRLKARAAISSVFCKN